MKIIQITDYSSSSTKSNGFDDLNKLNVFFPFSSKRNVNTNLGIYKTTKGYCYTDKYCGYVWLKDEEGNIVKENGDEVVLHISPRFGLDLNAMIKKIAGDDEFFEYLGLGTKEPLIQFFYNEKMMENVSVEDDANQLLSVLSFVILLEKITRNTLMKRMKKVQENNTGRVRGRIVMNKQLSKNILQGHNERIYCEHNERTDDIIENQILKYTLFLAEQYLCELDKTNNNAEIQRKITLIKMRMNNVSEKKFTCEDIDKVKIKLPNIYRNYVPVFEYAKVILQKVSVVSVKDGLPASVKIVPYAINSHILFECYARACLKEKIAEISNDNIEIKMLKYVRDKEHISEEAIYGARRVIRGQADECYIQGMVVPDIVIEYTVHSESKEKKYYRVYDVKYKDASCKGKGREDRLQLLAYNLLYNGNNNTGFIFPYAEKRVNGYTDLNIREEMYGADIFISTKYGGLIEAFENANTTIDSAFEF